MIGVFVTGIMMCQLILFWIMVNNGVERYGVYENVGVTHET